MALLFCSIFGHHTQLAPWQVSNHSTELWQMWLLMMLYSQPQLLLFAIFLAAVLVSWLQQFVKSGPRTRWSVAGMACLPQEPSNSKKSTGFGNIISKSHATGFWMWIRIYKRKSPHNRIWHKPIMFECLLLAHILSDTFDMWPSVLGCRRPSTAVMPPSSFLPSMNWASTTAFRDLR